MSGPNKFLIESQPAYLLHSRPFRDSSLLVDFLTRDHGRVRTVARGIRRPRAKNKALLQAFVPLQISLSGKRELKTLRGFELKSDTFRLSGNRLFAAMYLNELLVRLLHGPEAEQAVFALYENTLMRLSGEEDMEPVLRLFELDLLGFLGYGIEFGHTGDGGSEIREDALYYYRDEEGFLPVSGNADTDVPHYYPGSELRKIQRRDFSSRTTRKIAKRILRTALARQLGDRPLKSRQLFMGGG